MHCPNARAKRFTIDRAERLSFSFGREANTENIETTKYIQFGYVPMSILCKLFASFVFDFFHGSSCLFLLFFFFKYDV